jgi:hypothetical protein
LEARALEVFYALCGQHATLVPWASSPEHGALRWRVQDLGWRLTVAGEAMDGEAHAALDALLDSLAELCEQTGDAARSSVEISAAWAGAIAQLGELDAVLGEGTAASLGAVGYPIGDYGYSIPLIEAGLRSVTPLTMQVIEDAENTAIVAGFVGADEHQRLPLASRWTAYLRYAGHVLLGQLAVFEGALIQAKPAPDLLVLGRWVGGAGRLGTSYQIYRFNWNIVDVAARVETGELFGVAGDCRLRIQDEDGEAPERASIVLLVGYEPGGELVLADIEEPLAAALEGGALEALPKGTVEWLARIGAIEPEAWPV